jgi:hypothetical protein
MNKALPAIAKNENFFTKSFPCVIGHILVEWEAMSWKGQLWSGQSSWVWNTANSPQPHDQSSVPNTLWGLRWSCFSGDSQGGFKPQGSRDPFREHRSQVHAAVPSLAALSIMITHNMMLCIVIYPLGKYRSIHTRSFYSSPMKITASENFLTYLQT